MYGEVLTSHSVIPLCSILSGTEIGRRWVARLIFHARSVRRARAASNSRDAPGIRAFFALEQLQSPNEKSAFRRMRLFDKWVL